MGRPHVENNIRLIVSGIHVVSNIARLRSRRSGLALSVHTVVVRRRVIEHMIVEMLESFQDQEAERRFDVMTRSRLQRTLG